ncbi:MAG TPA: four helix bundle protein [Anaeromyxobacteraceae bacterium]|nr:four helix bundle protein [Anaeromyxobacteraceae bacterium]
MSFDAFDVALEMIRRLREPLAAISERDPALAQQLRRAAASVPLNLSEGRRRQGRDRIHLWRVAAGSADEVVASLRVAEAWGHVEAASITPALELCDRVLAMLWRLTH